MIKLMTAPEIRKLHEMLIQRYGGLVAEDEGRRLEAILSRIEAFMTYTEYWDVCDLAARYCHAPVKGHAFCDGNKRTGINATYLFLRRNGIKTTVPSDLVSTVVGLASGAVSVETFACYLRENCTQRTVAEN